MKFQEAFRHFLVSLSSTAGNGKENWLKVKIPQGLEKSVAYQLVS